ncbi:reverse transcriptase/maturase family protein [Pseudonocardia lacus]|jgi:group II intron reverse transcriptase/maturase|uniref:reverse transcriptase/maturase family protein n=1 Tax=Pseudonocardia lacus TaxID=2835865 RepID=UPI001BDD308A|nr:reverse transcriptase/maturase family protein [Pseudonocardia lacus]
MQNAETVLSVLRDRGRRGLPLEELYRQLFNPQLYLLAIGRLYSNHGAMTPGVDGETADGTSLATVDRITDAMRHERYRFRPARRVYIPKKNGKKRPLGLPSWSDKIVGEVVRLLLEAYYEPRFSDHSHGFRPRRGCHTALGKVADTWTGTTWFIEGDIADCFGSLDHDVMLSTLAANIHDNRFLRLLRNMLQAGYLEDWVRNATLSGAPQGGVTSPVLSNIYLDRLDRFVETVLIPEYTRGVVRAKNPAYQRTESALRRARQRGDHTATRDLRKRLHGMPSMDPQDPGYRRLRYARYADDTLLGFTGPKAEAEEIKNRLATFLHEDLKLELSQEKTLITHARTQAASFLGYEITILHNDRKMTRGRRTANGTVALRVPKAVIRAKSAPYLTRGKPAHRPELTNYDDHTIVGIYGSRYRGLVQYYLLAGDVFRLDRLEWVMKTSMLKTLAAKHRSTVTTMANKYKTTVATPVGPRRCFEARVDRADRNPLVTRFGGIPLRRQRKAVLTDRNPALPAPRRKELITRLQAARCEICDQRTTVEIHQVPTLADLVRTGRPQPAWAQLMAEKRRKTLIVCTPCHDTIHARNPTTTPTQ